MARCRCITDKLKGILENRYCIFLVSVCRTILSFADPITDILTLVEFYRTDHKTWFAVGLIFIILPCVVFSTVYYFRLRVETKLDTVRYVEIFLCGFSPFLPALLSLKVCWKNLKRCWTNDSNIDRNLLEYSQSARFHEAVIESAPQFIIQFYAIIVQQFPVATIQMVSLPISFLSLAWAFISEDQARLQSISQVPNIAHKAFLFATHLFLLSSRLFAIGFFTVSNKWWVIIVLLIHSVSILTADAIWFYRNKKSSDRNYYDSALFFCFHWLRDDMSQMMKDSSLKKEIRRKLFTRMQLFSHVLFVAENYTMILLFYYSPFPKTWYSVPLTLSVCWFSVIGAVMRVAHFHFLIRETIKHGDSPSNQHNNSNI